METAGEMPPSFARLGYSKVKQGKQQRMVWGWGQESTALALSPLQRASHWWRKLIY